MSEEQAEYSTERTLKQKLNMWSAETNQWWLSLTPVQRALVLQAVSAAHLEPFLPPFNVPPNAFSSE